MAITPPQVPDKYRWHYNHAWTPKARNSPGFRRWLARHGMLSPHFSLAEAASRDGQAIPRSMRYAARNHAFRMEVLRHRLGDVAIPINSWYRSPQRNREVGGASKSLHMKAIACDIGREFCARHPSFDTIASTVFSNGGFGTYPGGARHVDSRGWRARWSTWTPGR